MWIGILALSFYYIGYLILFLIEGSSPYTHFMGFDPEFYFYLAIFWFLPVSFVLAILSIFKGNRYLLIKELFQGKVSLTCGTTTLILLFIYPIVSLFIGLTTALTYPRNFWCYVFHKYTYLIFNMSIAIFIAYLILIRFKKKYTQHEKT